MNEWMDGCVSGGEKDQKKGKEIANSISHHNLKESIHFVKQSVDLGVCLVYNTTPNSLCWPGPTCNGNIAFTVKALAGKDRWNVYCSHFA